MKKFVFKYENVLKMREDRLNEIRDRMRILNTDKMKLESAKDEMIDRKNAFTDEMKVKLEVGSKSHEFQRVDMGMKYYRSRIGVIDAELEEINGKLIKLQVELLEASKEKKIMDKLKEKDENCYMQEMDKLDLKVIEEIVNFRNFKDKG